VGPVDSKFVVMAGFIPAIHIFLALSGFKDVDGRDEPGHDDC
jgi:hypothetical protein